MTEKIEIQGYCDEKFMAVKEAFAKNFVDGREVGASYAATIEGEFVVDIWAGHKDEAKTQLWEKDTIVNVYSTTKAMAALCTLMLVDRGLLDLDAPVAHYWPEFAQGGKEKIPVRQLLSHTSGLAGFAQEITVETLYDWDKTVSLLAAQEPWWEPGTASGYHAITFGYLLGELVRRITGKTMGTFFKEEVAGPLNADFHIGVPEDVDPRVGQLIPPPLDPDAPTPEPGSVGDKMSSLVLTALESRTRAWRAAEIPAANGHGNARSVARVASAMACGGEIDGIRLLSMPTLEKTIEEQIYQTDLVLGIPLRWGLGFGLASQEVPFPNPRSFYWGGWGGSMIAIDLDAKMSAAYVMNKMVQTLTGDERIMGLSIALFTSMAS